MNAHTPTEPTPSPSERVNSWKERLADLQAKITAQEAALAELEAAAGEAALAGEPLPDVAAAEATLRAFKRAKALAEEQIAMAQAEVTEEQRAAHRAAAARIAAERAKAAQEIDAELVKLERMLKGFDKLGQHWKEQSRAGGLPIRPGPATSPSRMAGAVLSQSPTLFSLLGVERPQQSIRQPLATYVEAAQRNSEGY